MIDNIVDKFLENPTRLGKGAGYLATLWKVQRDDIYKAKIKAKEIIHGNERANLSNIIKDQEDQIITLISEKVSGDTTELQYSSLNPLSREEIEALYKIDNISTVLSSYWNKQLPSGKYIVSANVKCLIKDFYSEDKFADKIKNIFNDVKPVQLPIVQKGGDNALFIYISDDHAGLQLNSSLFNNSWNKEIYFDRMIKVITKAISLGETFKSVVIVRLGDEADGWNGRTTRYDHSLGSASNKEQFDIFSEVNKVFYDMLFSSGIGEEYMVVSCNNSNHTGLGLSYIYHKAIEFYIENKYPQVSFLPIEEFISGLEWGNHVIGLTHGKDEKYMKAPLPLNLDTKTDLWLFEYYDNKNYSPNEKWISTIKGDIHKFNINEGKSSRYVNVPSICGSSEWIEHNFGNSKPGALLEVYNKFDPDILTYRLNF